MSSNFLEISNVFDINWCKTMIKYINEKLESDINTIEKFDRIRENNIILTTYITDKLLKQRTRF